MQRPSLAIDFDGVLAAYSGWKGEDVAGDPLPGAKQFCQKVLDAGWNVVVFSCRERLLIVENWLRTYGFPVAVSVHRGIRKPRAKIYVDDHGVTFNGNFDELWKAIQDFKPWWKKEK